MAAPEGITCACGSEATTVQDIGVHQAEGQPIVFGRIYTCDSHAIAGDLVIDLIDTESGIHEGIGEIALETGEEA